MQHIEQQLLDIENDFTQGKIDYKSIALYRELAFQIRQFKRFFDTLIKYELYKNGSEHQQTFFATCSHFGQKTIYNQYMPNYFADIIVSLEYEKADYDIWIYYINMWLELDRNSQTGKKYLIGLGLHFIATIATLKNQNEKKHLLEAILNHPIYKQIMPLQNQFFKTKNMKYLYQIHDICFNHIKIVRKTYNFNDPWINFYNHFLESKEYQNLMMPFYKEMDRKNINYKNKLVFFLFSHEIAADIGDNYTRIQFIIHWSLYHQIPLIAVLTQKQAEWISVYFRDYLAHIIIRDDNITLPKQLAYITPAANRAIYINQGEDTPPYYFARDLKRRFHHYTDHAEPKKTVPICMTTDDIKYANQKLFKQQKVNPNRVILIAPYSKSENLFVLSNVTLQEFWITLVNRLKKEGFIPVINRSHKYQPLYFKTEPILSLPLTHIIDFVNNIAGFIGVRSGLCDLLISSDNPKKYCVSPIEDIDWGNDLADWFYLVNFKFDDMEQHIDDIIASLKGTDVDAFKNQQCYGYLSFPDFS